MNRLLAGTAVLSLALASCGGGGGGVASMPPPAPTPTPTPSPTPTPTPIPSVPPGPIGLSGAASFSTYSAYSGSDGKLVSGAGGVEISYSAASNVYSISLPGFSPGNLVTAGGNGSFNENGWITLNSTSNHVTDGNSSTLQPVNVILDWPQSSELKYTSLGNWTLQNNQLAGTFVYGIPTAAGDVPLTGSASYLGEIRGLTDGDLDVFGSISFNFDFAAGTLSGAMNPEYAPDWDPVSLGTYSFTNTVFSKGSTTFSGSFVLPNGAEGASSFEGSFNGPSAAELMGSWSAPFKNSHNGFAGGTMSGVFTGKKGP